MAKKKFKFTTKTAAIIAIAVVVFVIFFATQGQTAKFYAATSQRAATGSGQVGVVISQPMLVQLQPIDLTPTDVYFEYPYMGSPPIVPEFVVTVKNIGTGNAANVDVAVYDKDGLINTCAQGQGSPIPSIAAGASATCGIPTTKYDYTKLPTYVKVVVDQNNNIKESNEGNNVLETNNVKTVAI